MSLKQLGKTKYTESVVVGSVDMSTDPTNYKRSVCIVAFASGDTVATGDGTVGFCVPGWMNGLNLTDVDISVATAGATSGTTDVQIRRRRGAAVADMLTTKVTLATSTYTSSNGVVNGANDDLATGDIIFADVDAVNGTPPVGLFVTLTFSN